MSTSPKLFNIRMADDSRHFFEIPEDWDYHTLRDHLQKLEGAKETGFLDAAIEMWLDFTYDGHSFSINDQSGHYWFFVDDAQCPEAILERVAQHFLCL